MNITLYKATELATLENFVDAETGEIDVSAYDDAKITLAEKQRAVVAYTRNLQVRKAALTGMKNEYLAGLEPVDAELAKITRQENFYMEYLFQNMQRSGITKIDALDGSFSAEIKTNQPSVIIDDLVVIPIEFKRFKPPPAPEADKIAIKEALKAGLVIEGAHLESSQKLVIK
jgi:hypothetical protein